MNINQKTKTNGVMPLTQVVASILNKRNDYSKHDRKRLLQFAIEGFREFGLYHLPTIQSEWIKVNQDLMTVPLPDQLMEFLSVGIALNGEYWEFTKIENGINPQGFKELNEERQEVDLDTSIKSQNFATPGGQNEYKFDYDKNNRRLVIYTNLPLTEVLVIYKSTGINADGDTLIPIHAFQALRAYIQMEDIDDDTQVSMGEKARRLDRYLFHLKNMRDAENRFTVAEFLDAARSGYGQTYKR